MEVNRDPHKYKSNFGLTCTKYLLFILNVVFVIAGFATIMSGTSAAVAISPYYILAEYGLNTLITLGIVTGAVFMIVGFFGIFAAFEQSTAFANLYVLAMMFVVILEMATAITSFVLISKSSSMVHMQLDTLMRYYSFEYRKEVDLIQSKLECCGINGPADWQNFDEFSVPTATPSWYHSIYPTTSTEAPRTDLMPASCCLPNSNYVYLRCEQYHISGCSQPVHRILSESLMITGSFALVLSVLQILGIVIGLAYARIIRCNKTERDVQTWNSGRAVPSREPTYVRYSPVH